MTIHWKYWYWSWNSNTLATWCEELSHWKRRWCWERLKAGREGDDTGWDGRMTSWTWSTWVWAGSGSWWWAGKPGMLQSMGWQRVRHAWETELNWTELNLSWFIDLTFQGPLQYWSLQHLTLLSPPDTSTTGRHFCFGSASSFLLELFLHSFPVAYWESTDLGSSYFGVIHFAFSYHSWDSQGKNAKEVCDSLLQWTTFCQNSPTQPICLGCPYKAWLIVSFLL